MSLKKLYLAVTSHGFGHAVRSASVAAAIQKLNPKLEIIFATTAPKWLLGSYLTSDFIYHPRVFDVGVIQSDSLTMDKAATLAKMQEIKAKESKIIAQEAAFVREQNVGLVLGDIPPLVAKVASAAKIPCWMMSNFGWDFIYRPWGKDFTEIVQWIAECYSQCDRLFRLPLAEPMSAFSTITDVGLTGGTPRYTQDELKAKYQIDTPKERTILLTFGGLGLQAIPYANLARFSQWLFITFDRHAPNLPNLLKVGGQDIRPVDFMPICRAVVSKPGYSTFAEALRLDTPIISLTRQGFAESPILLEGLANHSYHQILSEAEFFESDWNFLKQDLLPPQTNNKIDKNGTEAIANEVVKFFEV